MTFPTLQSLLEAFGAKTPSIPKGTDPHDMLVMIEDAIDEDGEAATYPIPGYRSGKAIKFICEDSDEVDGTVHQITKFLEKEGDAMIGSTPRGGVSPSHERFSQKVFHMGNELYVGIAWTGPQEKKTHVIYVIAYKK